MSFRETSSSAGSRAGDDSPHPARRLLGEFAGAWTRAVLQEGAAPTEEGAAALCFVDPFAGVDHPHGPPLCLGVAQGIARGTARHPAGTARALLLDEDPVKVEWIRRALRDAGLERDAEAGAASIEAREGDLAGSPDVPGLAREAASALVLLDPPSAAHLPLDALRPLLSAGSVDLLLRFPAGEVRRLARYHGSTLADLPPYAKRIIHGCSLLLGDARQGWFFTWNSLYAEQGPEAAEAALLALYMERLREAGAPRVRRVEVAGTEGREYLLLVAGDPRRALLLNEVLYGARSAGWLPWEEDPEGLVRYLPRGEIELFGSAGRSGGPEPRDRVVDTVALAHRLATRFAGRSPTLDRVLGAVVETDLFAADVKRALSELRRDGRALYRSLADGGAEIAFPRAGTRRTARRPRRGGGADQALLLPLDPEPE